MTEDQMRDYEAEPLTDLEVWAGIALGAPCPKCRGHVGELHRLGIRCGDDS